MHHLKNLHHKVLMLYTIYRYTPVVNGAFLPKCPGYSQCVYQKALVIVSALFNSPVIVSVLKRFYQNSLVIVSALKALCNLYHILSSRYLMSKTSENSSPSQSAFITPNLMIYTGCRWCIFT